MGNPHFAGSRVKLQRASRFNAELEAALNEYNKDDPVVAQYDFSKAPPVIVVNFKGLSPEVGAILGDAIHNMRTALDLMASELARINGKSDRNVYFPFAPSKADFLEAIKGKNFHKAGDDAVSLLHSFAPYRGGNELLRAIHDLDIEDKHTAVLDTEKTITIQLQGSYDISSPEVNSLSLDGSTIKHFFASGSPLSGRPIVETLTALLELVSEIVESFASMVDRRGSPAG